MTTPSAVDGSTELATLEVPGAPDALRTDEEEAQTEHGTAPPDEAGYTATIFPGKGGTIPLEFAEAALALQEALGQPVWLLVQGVGRSPYSEIDEPLRRAFFGEREHLRACSGGSVLVIDSLGGQAGSAYQIATLFRRHCLGFTGVVPRRAKSAATLLTLGAARFYVGSDGQLGPIDAQLWDSDREEYSSALDEVQALERLNSVALDLADQAMFLLLDRTGKKVTEILPNVLHFAAEVMQPMLDKIDTVHYTQRSRVLKVAEDYATRLLQPSYSESDAKSIARHFVNAYSEHEFVIDRDELATLLKATLVDADTPEQALIDDLEQILTETRPFTALGRVERRGGTPNGG